MDKKEDLSKLLDQLSVAGDGETSSRHATLDSLVQLLTGDCDDTSIFAVEETKSFSLFLPLLETDECQEKAAQTLAELAKIEKNREPCIACGLVQPLLSIMVSGKIPAVIQACRALGNICFDNDPGRNAVEDGNGLSLLIEMLNKLKSSSEPRADELRTVGCGFLLNLTNTREGIQDKAISLGTMELLEEYLRVFNNNETLCQMVLLCVGTLCDAEVGREYLSECNMATTVGGLLESKVGEELSESILELLASLAESDEVKVQLSQSSLHKSLIDKIRAVEKNTDEDSMTILKLASDLIILLLTGDGSMETLFSKGHGPLFKETHIWLKSSNEHLQISGALAMGNWARSDDHCTKLVKLGVAEQLLALLQTDDIENVSTILQHAVFSALRNLAIPSSNKSAMLKCNLLDIILPYIHTPHASIQFKLLGMLRMLVDGQEKAAKKLGTNEEFMKRLGVWCAVEDHAGVKGEANRLLAWLVKSAKSSEVMKAVVSHDLTPRLVCMANAEHVIMQNEALVALTLMSTSILDVVSPSLQNCDFVATMKIILTEGDPPPEILCNTLTLLKASGKSAPLVELFRVAELPEVIDKLTSHSDSKVKSAAKNVSSIFKT